MQQKKRHQKTSRDSPPRIKVCSHRLRAVAKPSCLRFPQLIVFRFRLRAEDLNLTLWNWSCLSRTAPVLIELSHACLLYFPFFFKFYNSLPQLPQHLSRTFSSNISRPRILDTVVIATSLIPLISVSFSVSFYERKVMQENSRLRAKDESKCHRISFTQNAPPYLFLPWGTREKSNLNICAEYAQTIYADN